MTLSGDSGSVPKAGTGENFAGSRSALCALFIQLCTGRLRLCTGRLRLCAIALVTALIATSGPLALNVSAQTETEVSEENSADETIVDGRDVDGIVIAASDALAEVKLQSGAYDAAQADLAEAFSGLADANNRFEQSTEDVDRFGQEALALQQLQDRGRVRVDKLADEVTLIEKDMKLLLTRRYVGGNAEKINLDSSVPMKEQLSNMASATMGEVATDLIEEASQTVGAALTANQEDLFRIEAERLEAENNLETSVENLRQATTDIETFSDDVVRLDEEVKSTRSEAYVGGTDMTLVAFDAYWRASQYTAIDNPSCGIEWWALAGIGRTESRHGQHSGGLPKSNGDVAVEIKGIALDGTNDTKAIGDTDGGAIDGDPTTDRAVGPMQFIPSTWVRFRSDMTGDGYSNPQNMYDSALAAANYLCRYGPGLDQDSALRRAFFGYNQSLTYVELVLGRAHYYKDEVGGF